MEIRFMQTQDVAAIAELEKVCFSDPWSENSIGSEIGNPLSFWLIAVENSKVIGYVGSQTVCEESDMMNIAVLPDMRRQGIAEKLIDELILGLQKRGSHCLSLEVRASNEPAKALYKKLGFLQVGRRPNYYRNPREDALILRKEWEN